MVTSASEIHSRRQRMASRATPWTTVGGAVHGDMEPFPDGGRKTMRSHGPGEQGQSSHKNHRRLSTDVTTLQDTRPDKPSPSFEVKISTATRSLLQDSSSKCNSIKVLVFRRGLVRFFLLSRGTGKVNRIQKKVRVVAPQVLSTNRDGNK